MAIIVAPGYYKSVARGEPRRWSQDSTTWPTESRDSVGQVVESSNERFLVDTSRSSSMSICFRVHV